MRKILLIFLIFWILIWLILILLVYHKYTRFSCIQCDNDYLDTDILYNKHIKDLDSFKTKYFKKYKNTNKKIVINRSNNMAMTTRDTSTYKSNSIKLDIKYDDIIKIDTKNLIVHVGAMITMGKLSNYLYKHGFSLPVVPEFRCLTVGGLICGAGIESSSFKYGLFPCICTEYTVLLSTGDIINVDDNNPELFSAIPLSYGTLCTILSVKLKIIKIKKYINIEIIPINNYEKIEDTFKQILYEKDIRKYDFIEGISYSKNLCLIILGFMSDKPTNKLLNNCWYKPFFYQSIIQHFNKDTQYLSMNILDYYFRHDRGSFWVYKYCLDDSFFARTINPFINNASDKLYIPQNIMKYILKCKSIEIQDSVVPLKNINKILDFVDKNYNIYPIWFCPCLNIDATLQQKKNAYKQMKYYIELIIQGHEELRDILIEFINKDGFYRLIIIVYIILNYNEGMDDVINILDMTDTIKYYLNPTNMVDLIESNKCFIYEDKMKLLLHKLRLYLLNKNTNNELFINFLLDCLKIKTSYFGLLSCTLNTDYFIDIGIYGKSKINIENKLNNFEKFTFKNEGFMGQYAITTLSREDFEKTVLKKKWYNYLRKKYFSDKKYPDIYDKLGPK
jgi:hypothetical protein